MIFLFEKKKIDTFMFLKTNYRNMLNWEQTYRMKERKHYILCVTCYITKPIVRLKRIEKMRERNIKCKTNFEREYQFKCLGK